MGVMVDRVRRELTEADIATVAGTYHAWRGEPEAGAYADVAGFCKTAKVEEVRTHGHILTPGRYVGAADVADDGVSFVERFDALRTTLDAQFAESDRLTAAIREQLAKVVISSGD
mgnify:FL=1